MTSRARLPDLDSARFIGLGGLEPTDSVRLLARISGRGERVAPAEADAARSIASACGYLPLALRIAGARLADAPELTMADLASLLVDERRRLGELEVGDVSMRTRLGTVAKAISGQARRALALLAAADQREISGLAIAALLDDDGALDVAPELADAGLLHRISGNGHSSAGIYFMHPLVRAYAAELRPDVGAALPTSALPGDALPGAAADCRLITSRADDRMATSRNQARP